MAIVWGICVLDQRLTTCSSEKIHLHLCCFWWAKWERREQKEEGKSFQRRNKINFLNRPWTKSVTFWKFPPCLILPCSKAQVFTRMSCLSCQVISNCWRLNCLFPGTGLRAELQNQSCGPPSHSLPAGTELQSQHREMIFTWIQVQ